MKTETTSLVINYCMDGIVDWRRKDILYTEVKRLGILLTDLAAAVVGFLEAVARHHVHVLGPDVEDRRRAQLAFEQCGLLDDDVVDLLLGRDDGRLSRRVDGEAGVDGAGGRGGAAWAVEAKAAVPERAEHPAPGRGRRLLLEQGQRGETPMVADGGGGGVGEPRRRCSYEYDGHICVILNQQNSRGAIPASPACKTMKN